MKTGTKDTDGVYGGGHGAPTSGGEAFANKQSLENRLPSGLPSPFLAGMVSSHRLVEGPCSLSASSHQHQLPIAPPCEQEPREVAESECGTDLGSWDLDLGKSQNLFTPDTLQRLEKGLQRFPYLLTLPPVSLPKCQQSLCSPGVRPKEAGNADFHPHHLICASPLLLSAS